MRELSAALLAILVCTACAASLAPPGRAPATSVAKPSGTPYLGVPLPDHKKTPGEVLAVTTADVCSPGYASKARDVSSTTKALVYRSYGVTERATGEYQVDHLIPLQLGGSNDVENLWPMRDEGVGGKAMKDNLETRLHILVCSGKLDLKAAQEEIAKDWYASYLARIGAN